MPDQVLGARDVAGLARRELDTRINWLLDSALGGVKLARISHG